MRLRRPAIATRLPAPVQLLVLARAVNRLGAFSLPFLSLDLVTTAGASVVQAGWVMTAFGLATIPSRLLGGRLTDRLGPRTTVTLGLLGTAVAQLGVAGARTLPQAALAAVAMGLAFEIYEPPSQALVADVTPPEQHASAFGLLSAALAVAAMGAGLLAAVVAPIGLRWLFVIDAASCLACAGIVWAHLPRGVPTPQAAGAAGRSPWRDRRLLLMLATGTVFATVYLQITIALPLTLAGRGLSPASLGLLLTTSAATLCIGQPLLRHVPQRFGPFTMMSVGYVLLAIGLWLNGFALSVPAFTGATVVWSVGDLLLLGHAYRLVAALAPPGVRGRYLAVYGTSWGLAAVVAPAVGTQLLAHAGPQRTWALVGMACAALAVIQPLAARVVGTRPPAPAPTRV